MPDRVLIFAPDLQPSELEEAQRLLRAAALNHETLIYLPSELESQREQFSAETRLYREPPEPEEWAEQPVKEVVVFDRDPRFFTAPRHLVPGSQALESVPHEVAQELIGFFSNFLDPGFIQSLGQRQIPIRLMGFNGQTRIEPAQGSQTPAVCSIVAKTRIRLLSISSPLMWRQPGYLAKVFGACADLGVSVDQVSASESEVTLTLDSSESASQNENLEELTRRLAEWGRVLLEEPCAAVTLVGQRIRSILTQLSPVLGRFEEERVFLISQSASDNNLTFVLEQAKSERLLRDLHALMFPAPVEIPKPTETVPEEEQDRWWVQKREALLKMSRHQKTPFFLLHQPTVERQLDLLQTTSGCDRFLFAVKANNHPDLLRIVRSRGVRFECVSPGEIDHLFALFPDMTGEEILYTPNFAGPEDFRRGFDRGTYVTLDNHSPLEDYPELFSRKSLVLRLDPGKGEGHHKHVKTAGRAAKFGIDLELLPQTRDRLLQLECRVIGLHCHAGSGIRSVAPWLRNARVLADQLPYFPDVRFLDLGGGFGIPERPGESALELGELAEGLKPLREKYPKLEFWLEPGRFIVAQAGVLLTRVTQTKRKGDHQFVGVDAGMNSLIRPALYGAYHPMVNLSRYREPRTVLADVVGPICESGDVLGSQRWLPESRPGDLVLIGNTGAYGRVMSSYYNMREPAPELWWIG